MFELARSAHPHHACMAEGFANDDMALECRMCNFSGAYATVVGRLNRSEWLRRRRETMPRSRRLN
jgi:hypothetical protein